MTTRLLIIFALLICFAAIEGQACAAPTLHLLSYPEAARIALESNPDLQILREQEASFKARAVQALSPNNPVFTIIQTDVTSPNLFSKGGATDYGISWTLGFPGKAIVQSNAISKQGLASRELALQKEVDVLSALSGIYVGLAVNDTIVRVLKEEQVRAKQTVQLTEKRYGAAQAAQTDILNARFYATGVDHDILVQNAAHENLVIQFRALLKRPEDETLFPAYDPAIQLPDRTVDYQQLKQLMLRNRPQLKALNYQREAADTLVSQATLAALPDFQFAAQLNNYHVDSAAPVTGLFRSYNVALGLAIPLFFPINELKAIHAARHDRNGAELAIESARLQLLSDLQSNYTQLIATRKLYQDVQELVVPSAKANYVLSMKAFEAGKLDYLKLLDARRSWIQAERTLLDNTLTIANLINQITQELGCDWLHPVSPHACKE